MVVVEMPKTVPLKGHPIQGDICGVASHSEVGPPMGRPSHHFSHGQLRGSVSLSSWSIQNPQVMNMLRSIIMLAAWLGFSYNSSGLASSDNSLADATYHFNYARLFSLAPSMK